MIFRKFILILLIFGVSEIYGQPSNDESFLKKKHLKYLAPKLKGRNLGRTVIFGDLNGDGIKDAFIDWCVEATDDDRFAGGGNALMFLSCIDEGFSVYIRKGGEYVLTTNKSKDSFTDYDFSYQANKIINGKIICSTNKYANNDPRCCPSLVSTIYLIFKDNKIIKPEQNPKITKQ